MDFLYSKSMNGDVILDSISFISYSRLSLSLPFAFFIVEPRFYLIYASFVISIIKFKYSMTMLTLSSAKIAFDNSLASIYAS